MEALDRRGITPPHCSGSVLLIEDNADLRIALMEFLDLVGFRVTAHDSGEDAMASTDPLGIDLLITDLGLRGIGGLELATRFRAANGDLPVIIMSGLPQTSLPTAGTGIRFLGKPFSLGELHSLILRSPLGRSA